MPFLFGFESEDTQSPPAALWTEQNLGDDATGSIDELSAQNVNVSAEGTVDPDDGTVAYQLDTSGSDIQLICQVPEIYLGTLVDFTFFGLQIREALTGAPIVMQLASPNLESGGSAGNRAKIRTVTDGTASFYAQGLTSLLRPKFQAITVARGTSEVKFWESDDGVANNYQQIGATLSQTLATNLYCCLYGNSQSGGLATASFTNATLSNTITISQAAPPAQRNLRGHLTWETGALQANGFQQDGLYTDGFFIRAIREDTIPTRTITNVTNSTTPVATYTGAVIAEGTGLMFSSVEGMTELEGRLFRARNPTSSTFDLYQDGDDTGYNPSKTTEGNTQTDTSGYGTFSGSALAQAYQEYSDDGDNLPANHDVKLEGAAFSPPSNDVGSANAMGPLLGSNFLSTRIHYWKDYKVDLGNLSQEVNNPRFSSSLGNGQEFFYNEEEFFCFPYFLPSNFDHETTHDGNQSRNQLYLVNAVDEHSTNNPVVLNLVGWPTGSFDHLVMDYATGDVNDPQVRDVDLGSIEGDVDLWAWVIIRLKNHVSDGILEVWRTTGADLGSGRRALTQVFSRTGVGAGTQGGINGFRHAFRQYKFGWHSSNNTIDSTVFWIGFDEFRYGGVNEGTVFEDIEPFQQSAP